MKLKEMHDLALKTSHELNGMNGDPSRAANWTREKRLADIVLALVRRIEDMSADVEVIR